MGNQSKRLFSLQFNINNLVFMVKNKSLPARREFLNQVTMQLMEAVGERENMKAALHRVKSNRGSRRGESIIIDLLRKWAFSRNCG